ncbi:hypothetical protein M0657_005928 [Pyricularia oryzae]|nr:hypothetical protein M9X92_010136 [Pyricularia oryzae]KAI7921736.1 hypothetical protein M0657_005928 [Pyricularia oryzae]
MSLPPNPPLPSPCFFPPPCPCGICSRVCLPLWNLQSTAAPPATITLHFATQIPGKVH